MHSLIRSPKEFWAGILYCGFGLAAVWFGREYPIGTGARMGPGYFPLALGCLLTLFGLVSLVRSLVLPGEAITRIAWKPLILITLGTVVSGILLPYVGLAVSLGILILLSAMASEKFRFEWKALTGMVLLIAACVFVFVKALGVPMPLIGSLFGG